MGGWEIALKFEDYASFNGDFWNYGKNAPLALHWKFRYSISSRELNNLINNAPVCG
jgi:hypothetical protein